MSANNIWIAVPSYWTFPSDKPGKELTIFDHPTPLNEKGTLERTLESFRNLKGKFNVLIVAAGTNPVIGKEVHKRVSGLIRPFASSFPIYLASDANLAELNKMLPKPILKLDSYGNIRNVQLVLPFAAGASMVVGIDDDEVIEDKEYLNKVKAVVGSSFKGETVSGIAGPYFDAKGEYRIADAEKLESCDNIFIKKNYFMNEALKKVMEPKKVVKSNVAFGGNMAMARATIARVCHDPYISRGEDYDYVITAAMEGLFYYFVPDAGIIHLPPDSTGSQAADKDSKLLADIRRFIYMKEKTRYHTENFPKEQFDLNYLMPYPGCYLNQKIDLQAHGIAAIKQKITSELTSLPHELVAEHLNTAVIKAKEFFAYRAKWQKALSALDKNPPAPKKIEEFRIV